MAIIYLSSVDGNNADDGSTWALAKATLAAALTAAGAGGTVYVDNAHAETQGSAMTLASPGTTASPVTVICVDRTGNPEPPTAVAATATVTTTGNFGITFTGYCYFYGVKFYAGTAGNSNAIVLLSASGMLIFDTCHLEIPTASGSSAGINVGVQSSGTIACVVQFINTTVGFATASGRFNFAQVDFVWRNTASALSGTIPTTLFNLVQCAQVKVSGVDLSAAGSGKTICDLSDSTAARVLLQNCKLGSSVTVGGGTSPAFGSTTLEVINCDSADTNYIYAFYCYQGSIVQETTIKRTGGASDGTTGLSHKFVSLGTPEFYAPLCGPWMTLWNETTGSSVTITAEVVTDNVTLDNDEAWIEVEYLGTSGFPQSLFISDRITNILTTPAAQTSSSETWTTTGLTTPVKQKLAVSFTPEEKGPIRARVCLARASTTMYVCPKLDVT